MSYIRATPSVVILVVVSLLVLSGCSFGGRQRPTRLYVLTALPRADSVPSVPATREIAIGVGPVTLPRYVNRPQIVTGNTKNEIHRAPFAQWAEPLEDNFTRVLAENLSILLATNQITVFPWKGPMPIDYQVVVEVTRFLGELEGEASLVALWSILGKNGKEVLVSKRANLSESIGPEEYEAIVAAMSQLVAALSREIAAEMTALSQQAATR